MNIARNPSDLRASTHKQQELCVMLFAAGEAAIPDQVQCSQDGILDILFKDNLKPELTLKHLCREAIRKHLLLMSRVNLFVRAPQLGLSSIITDYLVYDVNLDNEDDDNNEDDNDNHHDSDDSDEDR